MEEVNLQKIKVLVCVPRTIDGGGASYFNSLKNLFNDNIEYFQRGKTNWPKSNGIISEVFRIIKDYINFIFKMNNESYKLVCVNTFLGGRGLLRDLIFIIISKTFKKKIIVFFRGWNQNYLDGSKELNNLVKKLIFKSDALICLSRAEKKRLIEWGYNGSIFIESTTVDHSLVMEVTESKITGKYSSINNINLLYLSRVEVEKGIYETIDAFSIVKRDCKHVRLSIAGNGSELACAKKYVSDNNIEDIEFLGFVHSEKKKELFAKSHIYILPSYSEGMPNSVLEAIAFGLPVVTTNVGGLVDIIRNGKNGYIVSSRNAIDLAEKLYTLINDQMLMLKISVNNYNYAKKEFLSTVVVKRLESIFNKVQNITTITKKDKP